ncbi:acyltransferase family protein [Winslowiella iniecta]|uniref:Acyltransferase 3 domain-containing protein n=1 Tax=Winslowiella iniecta TaxID=1560201 RepID=A0A0L7THP5_9GAMM|nr:acyltransferase [Winslowiella iniecta]KOC90349.1 hypothetical protein NG42_09345 [Winslowiella iniecta]KOC94864.1 hypothetical protein NG43_02995 [Winslowiella iniecta]
MIVTVQLLRAIAAIMVVMYHISIKGEQYFNHALSWFDIGQYGVDLFFIISGFIMCYTTARRSVSFSGFMRDRIKRIIPLYWIMSTVALGVYLIAPSMVNSSGGETSIFSSYTLIPLGDKLLVQNGWTLSFEFIFYLIFASCLGIAFKKNSAILCTIIITALCLTGHYFPPENHTLRFLTNVLLLEFVLGIAAFYLLTNKNPPLTLAIPILIVGIALLAIQNQYGAWHGFAGRLIGGGIPMFMVFVGLVGMERYIASANFIFKRELLLSGDASYSIYLIHAFTLSACAIILRKLHLEQISILFSLFLLMSSIVAGIMAFLFVERPVNNYFKRRKIHRLNIDSSAPSKS